VGDVGPALDIDYITRRVAYGFAKQCFGVGVDQRGHFVEIIRSGKAGFDTLAREGVGEQVIGAAVELRGADDIAADFGDRLDGIAYRRHA
jgi:hypothetical protein